jgi:hypothetical protein
MGFKFFGQHSIPAHSLAELHEEAAGAPPSVERSVKPGPLSLSAHRNQYDLTDYEIGLSLGTKQVAALNGVTVEFSRSLAFRGESWGSRAYQFSDIVVEIVACQVCICGVRLPK